MHSYTVIAGAAANSVPGLRKSQKYRSTTDRDGPKTPLCDSHPNSSVIDSAKLSSEGNPKCNAYITTDYSYGSLPRNELLESFVLKTGRTLFIFGALLGAFPARIFTTHHYNVANWVYSCFVGLFMMFGAIRAPYYLRLLGSINEVAVHEVSHFFWWTLCLISWGWNLVTARRIAQFAGHVEALAPLTSPTYTSNSDRRFLKRYIILAIVSSIIYAVTSTVSVYAGLFGLIHFPAETTLFISTSTVAKSLHFVIIYPLLHNMFAVSLQGYCMLIIYVALRRYHHMLGGKCLFKPGNSAKFRQEYQKIIDLIGYFDGHWSWYILLSDGLLIVLVCTNLYMTSIVDQCGPYMIWLIYGIISLLLVNLPAAMANEIRYKTIDFLFEKSNQRLDHFSVCCGHSEESIKKQDDNIVFLYRQVTENRTAITAGYFFEINRTILMTIGSAIFSYFLIILQFSKREVQCQIDFQHHNNSL